MNVAADVMAGKWSRRLYALQECLRSAAASIRAHGLRSLLTMLGVIIGVASVICVIALVQGLSGTITKQFEGLGSSTLTLRAETPLSDRLRGQQNRLREKAPLGDAHETQKVHAIGERAAGSVHHRVAHAQRGRLDRSQWFAGCAKCRAGHGRAGRELCARARHRDASR